MRPDYDWSEAWDIHQILKCLSIREVTDVGCGNGELVKYLRSKGFRAIGCDVVVEDPQISFFCDITKPETVPIAEAWVFQHVLEHVPKDSWKPLFKRAREGGVKHIIIIVPGHAVNDSTHVCNHFTPLYGGTLEGKFGKVNICSINELIEVLKELGYIVKWFPDSSSVEAPWRLDYIIIASRTKHLTLRLIPWIVTSELALWLFLKMLRKLRRRLK
jgi:SAM-dependent methyltransferase